MASFQLTMETIVWGVALTYSFAALADPVTDADLKGKKICWNSGAISTYNKDGSYDSNRVGHGTWSLAGDVLTISASNFAGASNITRENGGFHSVSTGRHGNSFEYWGKYCN